MATYSESYGRLNSWASEFKASGGPRVEGDRGFRVLGFGFRVLMGFIRLGFRVLGLGFRVLMGFIRLGFRVLGLGFWVLGLGV